MSLIDRISEQTKVSAQHIELLARTASHRYKTYQIPKRSNPNETRTIHHPARPLKYLQRWLTRSIFSHLPVDSSATAYRRGISTLQNVEPHVRSNYFLKLDFKDFFPSFNREAIEHFLHDNHNLPFALSDADIAFIGAIVTRNGTMVIGAPSSPSIANATLHSLDASIRGSCSDAGVAYTRYADDITLSSKGPGSLSGCATSVFEIVNRHDKPRLYFNAAKTVHCTRKTKVLVTGLVITPQRKVSLGRSFKRALRTELFLIFTGRIIDERVATVRGRLAYAFSVESTYFDSLVRKFGHEPIGRLMRGEHPGRSSHT